MYGINDKKQSSTAKKSSPSEVIDLVDSNDEEDDPVLTASKQNTKVATTSCFPANKLALGSNCPVMMMMTPLLWQWRPPPPSATTQQQESNAQLTTRIIVKRRIHVAILSQDPDCSNKQEEDKGTMC